MHYHHHLFFLLQTLLLLRWLRIFLLLLLLRQLLRFLLFLHYHWPLLVFDPTRRQCLVLPILSRLVLPPCYLRLIHHGLLWVLDLECLIKHLRRLQRFMRFVHNDLLPWLQFFLRLLKDQHGLRIMLIQIKLFLSMT